MSKNPNVCMFNSTNGKYDSTGCSVTETDNNTFTCACTHLSQFANGINPKLLINLVLPSIDEIYEQYDYSTAMENDKMSDEYATVWNVTGLDVY